MKQRLVIAGLATATLVAGWWVFGRSETSPSKPSAAPTTARDVERPALAAADPVEPGHAVVYRNVRGVVEPTEIIAPVLPRPADGAPPPAPYWMHRDATATTPQDRRLPAAARDELETKRYEKQLKQAAAGKLDKSQLIKPSKPEVVPGANRMRDHVDELRCKAPDAKTRFEQLTGKARDDMKVRCAGHGVSFDTP